VLAIYDEMLAVRDDPVVRLNRLVALAEVAGAAAALEELDGLAEPRFETFLPYQAVRAGLLRKVGRCDEARCAYDARSRLRLPRPSDPGSSAAARSLVSRPGSRR
jgi:RNA polymerase sigma-70 factor (ECF subfamily)